MPRLRILIYLIVILLISLPYIQAELAVRPEYEFGGFFLNPLDGNTYLAKMRQGWDGAWQFRLPYTAEPGEGSFLFLFYLFLGHIARVLGLPLLLTFHIARLLAAIACLISIDRLFRALFPSPGTAGLAFALAALGSGMGWLAAVFGWVPADLWVAEAYPFLASFSNPHFPLSLAIMAWLLKPTADGRPQTAFLRSAAGGLLLSILSPFGVVLAGLVLAGLAVWQGLESFHTFAGDGRRPLPWSSLRITLLQGMKRVDSGILYSILGLSLGSAPMMLYAFWITRAHPVLAGWNAQNITPTPPAWDVVLSLSPALILAAIGALGGRREGLHNIHYPRLILWAGFSLLLIVLPLNLQLRFSIGLYIPLAGLAAAGIDRLAQTKPRRRRNLVAAAFVLSLPTLLFIQLAAAFRIQSHSPDAFMSRAEADAMSWIDHNTPDGSLILAAPDTSLFIPAHTGRRVLYGHPFETVNAAAEKAAAESFFQPGSMGDAERRDFLNRREVDFIFFGPREKSLGDPAIIHALRQIYSTGGVSIYAAR